MFILYKNNTVTFYQNFTEAKLFYNHESNSYFCMWQFGFDVSFYLLIWIYIWVNVTYNTLLRAIDFVVFCDYRTAQK